MRGSARKGRPSCSTYRGGGREGEELPLPSHVHIHKEAMSFDPQPEDQQVSLPLSSTYTHSSPSTLSKGSFNWVAASSMQTAARHEEEMDPLGHFSSPSLLYSKAWLLTAAGTLKRREKSCT